VLENYQTVSPETVWKLAGRDEWHVSWRREAPKKGSFRTVLWAQGTTKRSLHGVSRQSLETVLQTMIGVLVNRWGATIRVYDSRVPGGLHVPYTSPVPLRPLR
jgi:hypothetical protein